MFKNNYSQQKESIKEVVKMKSKLICLVFAAVAFCATSAWAGSSQTVPVIATVPVMTGGLTVAISKVTGSGQGSWELNKSSIDFGTLVWHPENGSDGNPMNIFLPPSYFAVDIGVTSNTLANWTLTHTHTSLAGAGGNLDDKVNVVFVKQVNSLQGFELNKVSFGNSNVAAFTKLALLGGWLRIYYGVGTGEIDQQTKLGKDAPGVTPIGLDTTAGTYTGSVKITLAP